MTCCEDFDKITVPDICGLLSMQNSFWFGLSTQAKPEMRCPFYNVITKHFVTFFRIQVIDFLS